MAHQLRIRHTPGKTNEISDAQLARESLEPRSIATITHNEVGKIRNECPEPRQKTNYPIDPFVAVVYRQSSHGEQDAAPDERVALAQLPRIGAGAEGGVDSIRKHDDLLRCELRPRQNAFAGKTADGEDEIGPLHRQGPKARRSLPGVDAVRLQPPRTADRARQHQCEGRQIDVPAPHKIEIAVASQER